MRDLSLSWAAPLLSSPCVGNGSGPACEKGSPLSVPRSPPTRPFSLPARSTRLSFARVVTPEEAFFFPPPPAFAPVPCRTSRSLRISPAASSSSAAMLPPCPSPSSLGWCGRLLGLAAVGAVSKAAVSMFWPPLARCEAPTVSPVVLEMVNWTIVWLRLLCVFICG